MSVDKFNSEGYYDPTAYEAMSTVEKAAAPVATHRKAPAEMAQAASVL